MPAEQVSGTANFETVFKQVPRHFKEHPMKAIIASTLFAAAAATLSLSSPPASAKGCLKGAIVGGVAGNFAGHHGLLGAGAGCAIGHHEATKHARERQRATRDGYGSSTPQ
jgi:hypothetical protein